MLTDTKMNKIVIPFLMVPVVGVLFIVSLLAITFIHAVIFYFAWNFIAPIYFATIMQPQFLHVPFLHCWVFLYIVGVIFGTKVPAANTK